MKTAKHSQQPYQLKRLTVLILPYQASNNDSTHRRTGEIDGCLNNYGDIIVCEYLHMDGASRLVGPNSPETFRGARLLSG